MLLLIDNKNITDSSVNLALEEFCVRNLDMSNDYLLFYINEPSIIIGKHQNTIEEINSDYVNEKNIRVVRRISGGGTVYHDTGNLNFSFMTKHSQKSIHNFKLFTEPVITFLQELGINAEINGRNDITVSDRKISGNAQFTDTKSMFSHGTLLFDSNLEDVVKALNVKADKIESKGIKSIRSRVANISEFMTGEMSVDEFKRKLTDHIFKGDPDKYVFRLSEEQWKKVHDLAENKYRSWDWNYGRSPEFNIQRINRFPFGQIDAKIFVKDGLIENIKIYGDFLGHGDLEDIQSALVNVRYDKDEIKKALTGTDLSHYFGGITVDEFAEFISG